MELNVPTNWQEDFLDRINISRVTEIYGKLEKDFIGGAHASFLLPPVTRRRAAEQVARIRKKGIRFTYLLNPSCLGSVEFTRQGQRNIRRLLEWLSEIGVDGVTVAIPFLLQLIKKQYPDLRVSVSVGGEVDTPLRARYWEDLGADSITLSGIDVNRNFALLKQIRASVRCSLQVIANLPCLPCCLMHRYHSVTSSHASRGSGPAGGGFIDYCSLMCRYMRLSDPKKFISAVWIRPEDVRYYEDAGIDRIKLVDRGMKTEFLARIVEAYTNGEYKGNLLDLFPFNMEKYVVSSPKYLLRNVRYFFHPFDFNPVRFLKYGRACAENPVYLDNTKLHGFLDHFMQGRCVGNDCASCGYCQNIADKALVIPPEYREKSIRAYEELLNDIMTGRLFYSGSGGPDR